MSITEGVILAVILVILIALTYLGIRIREQQQEDRTRIQGLANDVSSLRAKLNSNNQYLTDGLGEVIARVDALERAGKPKPEPVPHRFCGHHIIYDGPIQVGTPDYHDFYCAKTAGHDGPHKDQRPGFELEWSETYT